MANHTIDQIDTTDYSELTTSPSSLFTLASVEVVAKDLIYLTFSRKAQVNTIIQSTSSYRVIDKLTDSELSILSVLVNTKETSILEIQLVVKGLVIGRDYIVYCDPRVSDYLGKNIDNTLNYKQFTMRRTKVDGVLSNIQELYSKDPKSQVRYLLSAIGREDDLIGGSKDELL